MNQFKKMTWDEYQHYIEKIADDITQFLIQNNITIDFIVPVLRGGGIPAISLSHLLKIKCLETIQLFHDYVSQEKWLGCNTFDNITDKSKAFVILLTDDFHATGQSIYFIYDVIKDILPNAKIIYASIGRDIGYLENERDFLFSCYGFLSNECGVISNEELLPQGTITDNTIFPWELFEEEFLNIKLIEGE